MILYDIRYYILFYRIVYLVVLYIFIYNWPQTMFCIHILIQFTVWCRPTIHLNNTWWSFRTFNLTFIYYLCKCVTLMCFRPCWPIRSLKKFPVGGDNSAGSDVTSQKLRFRCLHDNRSFRKSSPWQEFSKMLGFSDLVQSLREDEPPNYGINFVPIKMSVIFQETYENINWNGIKCLWNWKNK